MDWICGNSLCSEPTALQSTIGIIMETNALIMGVINKEKVSLVQETSDSETEENGQGDVEESSEWWKKDSEEESPDV